MKSQQQIEGGGKCTRFVLVSSQKQSFAGGRVTFIAKITKDEVIKAHKRKPFWWTDNLGVFEFLNTSEALSIHEQGKGGKKKED